jgi:hypothetical protein
MKVEDLKSQGQHEAAGELAASLGHDRQYGCHYGMRSTRLRAIEEFNRGYDREKAKQVA